MDEKKRRTEQQLEAGLKKIVAEYQIARCKANHDLADKLKKCIEDIIRAKDLDPAIVYNYSTGKTVPIKVCFDETETDQKV
ncbi:hypothetical protein JXQ70_02320 [bacterium]|nr:hypothetical protein [bacterium]